MPDATTETAHLSKSHSTMGKPITTSLVDATEGVLIPSVWKTLTRVMNSRTMKHSWIMPGKGGTNGDEG